MVLPEQEGNDFNTAILLAALRIGRLVTYDELTRLGWSQPTKDEILDLLRDSILGAKQDVELASSIIAKFKLSTPVDLRRNDNQLLHNACLLGYLEVVQALFERWGMDATDVSSELIETTAVLGHVHIVTFLCRYLPPSGDDVQSHTILASVSTDATFVTTTTKRKVREWQSTNHDE